MSLIEPNWAIEGSICGGRNPYLSWKTWARFVPSHSLLSQFLIEENCASSKSSFTCLWVWHRSWSMNPMDHGLNSHYMLKPALSRTRFSRFPLSLNQKLQNILAKTTNYKYLNLIQNQSKTRLTVIFKLEFGDFQINWIMTIRQN